MWQLRTYRIRPGAMDDFRDLWAKYVVPSRRKHGFEVKGGWFDASDDVFVWLVGLADATSWQRAERAYYADPERASWPSLGEDVIRHVETRMLSEA